MGEGFAQRAEEDCRGESGFKRVKLVYGYPSVRIISPPELVYGDEDQNI
jgi:hypothetical protein